MRFLSPGLAISTHRTAADALPLPGPAVCGGDPDERRPQPLHSTCCFVFLPLSFWGLTSALHTSRLPCSFPRCLAQPFVPPSCSLCVTGTLGLVCRWLVAPPRRLPPLPAEGCGDEGCAPAFSLRLLSAQVGLCAQWPSGHARCLFVRR